MDVGDTTSERNEIPPLQGVSSPAEEGSLPHCSIESGGVVRHSK